MVTAFVHGVHGNEISSSGAAMAEAYHLLAARGDATVDLILRESLVLIDPMQNPDGRARFVFQNTMGRALGLKPGPRCERGARSRFVSPIHAVKMTDKLAFFAGFRATIGGQGVIPWDS